MRLDQQLRFVLIDLLHTSLPDSRRKHYCFRFRLLSSKPSFSRSTMVIPWLTAYPLNSFLNSVVTLKLSVSVPTVVDGGRSLLLRCDDATLASAITQVAPFRTTFEAYVLKPKTVIGG